MLFDSDVRVPIHCGLATVGAAVLALFTLVTGLFHSAAVAQTAGGGDVRLLVGQPAGGGYDLYARLLAKHLPRFLPGRTKILTQNMPGAGSLTMASYLYTQAPRDGSVIGLGGGTIVTAGLFGFPGAHFDARDFSWIGSMNSEIGVSVAWHSSEIKTAADVFAHEFLVAGAGASSNSVLFPRVLNSVLGTKFKVVSGYQGSADSALAMERGEVQGVGAWNYSSLISSKAEWLKDGKVVILMQISLQPHPDLPSVPTIIDLTKTEEQRAFLSLVLAAQAAGRPVLGPPGMAIERKEQIAKAFDAMLDDREFRDDAGAVGAEVVGPMSGRKLSELVAQLYKAPAQQIKQASAALAPPN